jgi:hypothetical protein
MTSAHAAASNFHVSFIEPTIFSSPIAQESCAAGITPSNAK